MPPSGRAAGARPPSKVRVGVLPGPAAAPVSVAGRRRRQLIPRPGVAEDVATMVCALMDNPAVTNAVVDVDGGERLGTYPGPANSRARRASSSGVVRCAGRATARRPRGRSPRRDERMRSGPAEDAPPPGAAVGRDSVPAMRSRERRYAGAVGTAALQGLVSAVWVAAEELPPGARRLTRLGMSLAVAAVGAGTTRDATEEGATGRPPERRPTDAPAAASPGRLTAAPGRLAAAAVLLPVVTVGPMILRRRLERRWLDQAAAGGHLHPHRVVALRIGLLSFLMTLVSNLVKAHQAGTRPGSPQPPT